ncbi:ABC transporter ATP-binding protein [Actinoplanes sp. NPDC026619]|uniref:ABC transporter ATP-binding protein n=1 Tax=Actinoplanes sp. NPDC026619 TaxID=3155798 RepID=UPI0033E851B6
MTSVLHAERLTKRYGKHPGLVDADLDVPPGRVVGLVGPNGAGKSTLLGMTCGLIKPTSGTIDVLGSRPAANASQLAKVGFVAQDTPVYANLSVGDHLKLGAHLNKTWDNKLAERRIKQVGLDLSQKAGRLSGGQRAQLALTVAAAKRPELLIFDEPVAALDPLARHQFLQNLMEFVSELAVTVVLSSHILADLERVCDYLILLAGSRVQLAGNVDVIINEHYRLFGSVSDLQNLPAEFEVIRAERTGSRSSVVVRQTGARSVAALFPQAERLDLEEMILAYMVRANEGSGDLNNVYSLSTEARR